MKDLFLGVFIVLIVLFVVNIVHSMIYKVSSARYYRAKSDIRYLEGAIKQYQIDFGKYPNSKNGIKSLLKENNTKKDYIIAVPKDPWGKEYYYVAPGKLSNSPFDIWSYGADGIEGGIGKNEDIGNWKSR